MTLVCPRNNSVYTQKKKSYPTATNKSVCFQRLADHHTKNMIPVFCNLCNKAWQHLNAYMSQ